ncbi:hypothetical protein GCM10027037_04680 [Mucilaginibacter koreensis]
MQSSSFYLNKHVVETRLIESELSFEPFIRYLQNRIKTEKTIRAKLYEYILNEFESNAACLGNCFSIDDLQDDRHKQLLELMYAALTPALANEKDYMWALSTPVPNKVFYSTEAFYDFTMSEQSAEVKSPLIANRDLLQKQYLDYVYRLILKRLYHFTSALSNEIYYSHLNAETKLCRYYKIHVDTNFIDIEVKGELPELTFETIEPYLHDEAGVEALMEILPLQLFKFKGFAVITLQDVTARHAIDEIRNAIIDHGTDEGKLFEQVIQLLKTLTEDDTIEFGLLPFIKINGEPVFDSYMCSHSMVVKATKSLSNAERTFRTIATNFESHPKAVYYSAITEARQEKYQYLKILKQAGVQSYACIPLLYNKHLAGVLEIYSFKQISFAEELLSKIDFTLPLLSQLLQNSLDHFNAKVDQVIKDNFTSLQPSVQWKFNEAAWNYLQQQRGKRSNLKIETVEFKDVFPLYGAIDIRNSTQERNNAMQQDMSNALTSLLTVLNRLQHYIEEDRLNYLLTKTNQWLSKISESVNTNDKLRIDQFLENEVKATLTSVKESYTADTAELIDEFIAAIRMDSEGPVYAHQNQLETSIQLINTSINKYLEQAQPQLQEIYPSFFEKFRTDGVEYDIYVGQSIAPDQAFNRKILEQVRVWQLTSMVDIARLTHSLQQQMPVKLQTTQLVFIHSNPIDINFRNDERRFDVEGVYNIRYEVVKKRIDKVLVKGKDERLTQPGKIALVYLTKTEAKEYRRYIQQLQKQNLLAPELEELELEEIQDVKGLKALRVTVNIEE